MDSTRRSRSGVGLTIVGCLLLVGAAVGVAYPLWWQHRSDTTGRRLLAQPLSGGTTTSVHGRSTSTDHPTCSPSSSGQAANASHLAGILQIPSLQLRAPVVQGVADAELNVAVGHDPASPWPGGLGESIVEAHDVSYFSHIDSLKDGTLVEWRDACRVSVFRVTSTEVSTPGTLLQPPPAGRGLALVTCYPTDALFWTPDRFVVQAVLVSSRGATSTASVPQTVTHLVVPAPRALLDEGLTLQDNPILLGRLSLAGDPATAWSQGPAPLDVEADALESFFGAQKAIAQDNPGWWSALSTPGVAMPAAWDDSTPLFVTIDVVGRRVSSVTLTSENVTMRLGVVGDRLLISSVSVS